MDKVQKVSCRGLQENYFVYYSCFQEQNLVLEFKKLEDCCTNATGAPNCMLKPILVEKLAKSTNFENINMDVLPDMCKLQRNACMNV